MLYGILVRGIKKRMKGWDCILRRISETVGCNLSSEGKMTLDSEKKE